MENGKENKSTFRKGIVWISPVTLALIGALLCKSVPDSLQWTVSIFLIAAAVLSCLFYIRIGESLVDLRALLSLSWLFGLGLANLRLSNMHEPWSDTSIFCFFSFYAIVMLSYEALRFIPKKTEDPSALSKEEKDRISRALFRLVPITSGISFLCFCLEAIKLRYIPLFATFTHAYNYFHVSGLHYFTFSSMFTHALTVLYLLYTNSKPTLKQKRILIVSNLFSLAIPILCISKLQFLLIFFYPVMIFLYRLRIRKLSDLPLKRIGIAAACLTVALLLAGVVFTARRNYPEGYLEQIFDMKDPDTPAIGQILYMYVSHNYANFNHMTLTLTEHAHGLRSAFPLVALTGLKFLAPSLAPPDPDLIKQELSTLTVIYDAYYDFGIPGVVVFSILVGLLFAGITRLKNRKESSNPISLLMCAELALYAVLSFFDTWFSNPTVWFWFAITILMYIYVEYQRRRGRS